MTKQTRDSNLIVRMSAKELQEIDDFMSTWENAQGVSLTRSKLMRLALDEFIAKYDFEQCSEYGNQIETRINPYSYDFFELASFIQDLKDTKNKEVNPSYIYFYKAFIDVLETAFTVDRNAKHTIYSFGLKSKKVFYNYMFKINSCLMANLWTKEENKTDERK